MSREEVCRELLIKIAEEADGLTANEVIALCLEDIATSLAQIADSLAMPVSYNPSKDIDETINRIFGFDKEGE